MPDSSIDPASLQGDALTRWYQRSPEEVEQERQTAEARRRDSSGCCFVLDEPIEPVSVWR